MNQRNPTMKLIASAVVFTFFVTSLGITPNTFAATGVPINALPAGRQAEVSPLTARTLTIPAELGQVTDSVMGDSTAPSFIHIQSAHGNYQAEKNIETLLGYIEKNSSVKLMLLEGAANKLQPELFRLFPKHPDFNRKVTDKLMQEGYLTGPESFLIDSSNKTEGWGIEDLDAYKKDREAFISVVKKEKTAEKFLGSLRATIDKRFSSKLNKDLLNLVRQEEALGFGTLSFEGWLKAIYDASKKYRKLDLSDAFYQDQYPFLIRYYRLQEIGSKIDREKALKEADTFLKELAAQKVSAEIIENFKTLLQLTEKDLLKSSSLTSDGYSTFRRAFDLAFNTLPKDFSMTRWPNWTLYAQYIILMQEMEGKGLHEETVRLKDQIQAAVAKTAAEKEYLANARELYLLRKLFDLELTRSEYQELTQTVKTADIQEIRTLYKDAMNFYSIAVDRENKMFANALKRMSMQKQDRAVIVTGGFHAEGLKKLAASKNASYIQITPRITEISKRDHEVYLRSVMGSRGIETSQMSALLGIVDPTQRVTVTGITAAKDWVRDVRGHISSMINSESAPNRAGLNLAFSSSIFESQALAPVRSEIRADQDSKAIQVETRRRSEVSGKQTARAEVGSVGKKFLLAIVGVFVVVIVFVALVKKSLTHEKLEQPQVLQKGIDSFDGAFQHAYDQVMLLGNTNDTSVIPVLIEGLFSEKGKYDAAVAALVKIGEAAVPAIIKAKAVSLLKFIPCKSSLLGLREALNEGSYDATKTLVTLRDPSVVPELIKQLKSDSFGEREDAANELAFFKDQSAVPADPAVGEMANITRAPSKSEDLSVVPGLVDQFINNWDNRAFAAALIKIGDPVVPVLIDRMGKYKWGKSFKDIIRLLGAIGSPSAVPALTELLMNKDILYTGHFEAAVALGEIKDKSAVPALIARLKGGETEGPYAYRIRPAIARALGEIGDRTATPALIALLNDPKEGVSLFKNDFYNTAKVEAIKALGRLGDRSVTHVLIDQIKKDPGLDSLYIETLGKIKDPSAVPALITQLMEKSPDVGQEAAEALGEIGDRSAVPALVARLKMIDQFEESRDKTNDNNFHDAALFVAALNERSKFAYLERSIIEALGAIGDPAAVPVLVPRLRSNVSRRTLTEHMTISALEKIGDSSALPGLIDRAKPVRYTVWSSTDLDDRNVHKHVVLAIGAIGDPSALPALWNLANEIGGSGVQAEAKTAIREIWTKKVPELLSVSDELLNKETDKKTDDGHSQGATQPSAKPDQPVGAPRSESRFQESVIVSYTISRNATSLGAKIGTAVRAAANTVSPLLSSSTVYAAEIAPEIFGDTEHFQKAPDVPEVFAAKWPMFSKIISRFATASTERMVIDQRQGVPDAASVLPLVTFALYNPKAAVVLALIADSAEVTAFEKELTALSQKGSLPQNFAIRAFANENEFVGAFAGFYNSAAPLGQSVALITDREDSVVTQKIGSRRHLLSVVGAQNPLKQTASTLLAADKLLNESIWSMGYHFVSVDKLGGLEALMAELTSYVAAQAKVLASA